MAEKGFTISVSIEALRETWGQSLRENRYELLSDRARMLAPYLDASAPVAFVAAALLEEIGEVADEVRHENAGFRDRVTRDWRALSGCGLTRERWMHAGAVLEANLAAEEAMWMGQVNAARDAAKKGRAHAYPATRAMLLLSRIPERIPARTSPPLAHRAHAHFRYMAGKLANALAATPQQNDFHDARYLYHLAWPAFLMTVDLKLIGAVDRSGTFQRQWVRTPVELVEDRVARAEPWGKPAIAVAAKFAPRDKTALSARLTSWRAGLRR